MEKKLPRIERGVTEIIVPHENGERAFNGRNEGPDDYSIVGRKLLARNLKVPVGHYSASLIHAAYCVPEVEYEPEFENIRDIMRKEHPLWVFNRNLWTFDGVYVVLDLNAVGTSQSLNQDELEKMLKGGKELNWGGIRFSKDKKVRFAPKGSYKLGEHTSKSLAKDGFVIASHNPMGAEKLGEASTKFEYTPRTYGRHIGKKEDPKQQVSALSSSYGDRLCVAGNYGDYNGYAFGVLE